MIHNIRRELTQMDFPTIMHYELDSTKLFLESDYCVFYNS